MPGPILLKPIPAQQVNEKASYGPIDLKQYIESPSNAPLIFQAGIKGGAALPAGIICTSDGIVTGIAQDNTEGRYEVELEVKDNEGILSTGFNLTILPSLLVSEMAFADQIKSQIWEALEKGAPVPDLSNLYQREITPLDIAYLLERWGMLTIWNAYDLAPPSDKKLLNLEGVSSHYQVYDRGSSLVATPKDLFSYERTIEDGLQTARAMAHEVYNRGWAIQMAGFYKLMRATWLELQLLSDKHGRSVEFVNFTPQLEDLKLYQIKMDLKPGLNVEKTRKD